MHRTYVAVALLLLAGGLSTPALVGPMLNRAPEEKLVAPDQAAQPERIVAARNQANVPRFGRDIAGRATGAVPQLDGVELGQALGTPIVPEYNNANARANRGQGGGTGWAATRRNTNNRGGNSDSGRVFSGGSVGGATPGLMGWGLRDARRTEALKATTPASPRANNQNSQGNNSNSGGNDNAQGGNQQAAAPAPTGTAGAGLLGGGVGTSATPGSMPASTPEPATLLLVGGGTALAGLFGSRRRQRQ